MIYLIIVSIIWALSFSLIKGSLTTIDSNLVAFIPLGISFLIFLPFVKIKNISKNLITQFIFIGFIQYGLMYVSYIYAYKFLEAYQVAILTIFTPIFIVIIYDLWEQKFRIIHLLTALLAVVGAGIVIYSDQTTAGIWKGILLIQISNLCFAFGQVYFKKVMVKNSDIKSIQIFALLYFGSVVVAGIFSFSFTDFSSITITANQWLSLIYLGVVASGIGFFLWNIGVTKVEAGSLAVLNNLKIPLAILFAFIILGESMDLVKLTIGSAIILIALFVNKKYVTK
ncbi:MAG: EamA family transporter [Arcobacter sp.]|nr:EamA family transporter [Arcobacter sp.]